MRAVILQDAPQIKVLVQADPSSPPYYYLVIMQNGQPRFVIRSLEQWRERRHLIAQL